MIKGAHKTVACQKKEGSSVSKCQSCKKPIKTGDLYTAYGLKARTYYERTHAKKRWGFRGCWFFECDNCSHQF